MSKDPAEVDVLGIIVLVVVATCCVSSIIEVWRGTAHVDGCDCIVHYDKPSLDAGVPQ
jgi:hypothetical protein